MGKVYTNLRVDGGLTYNNNPTDGYLLSTNGDGLISFTQSSVIESADYSSLPASGLGSRLYITLNNNNTYRWDGSAYQPITGLLLTTNIVYVSKNGNDSLGARHDLGKPFLTVEAAVAIMCWSSIRFSGHCGSLVTQWNGIGQYAFIGGSCQYVTCGAGYVETTLGGSSTTESSVSVSSGTVIIKECIGNLLGVQINSTGGELHMYMLKKDNTGRSRVVAGGTVYLYDVSMSTAIGTGGHSPIIKLQSGTLYLRGRIALTNTTGNPYDANNPATLTQTNKSNIIVWTGGNLILDGCTLITQDQNDLPFCSRTASQVLLITTKGVVTNRPEVNILSGSRQKILMTVINVSYTTVNTTINCGTSVNFSVTTSGKTTTQVATELVGLINADPMLLTATDNLNGSFYLEADVAGTPFTYSLYNQPYNGDISLTAQIYRDNSYPVTNPMGGQIIESSYAQ